MFCNKCGTELSEKDQFCYKCGASISQNNELKIEIQPQQEKKKRNKTMIYIVAALVVVVCIVAGVFLSQPKIHEVDVATASEMIYSGQMEDYYGDIFQIKGILVRDNRETSDSNYFSLVSTLDDIQASDPKIIVFNYNQTLAESVGTGSEIIIKGKLNSESGSGSILVDEIQVIKEECIYYTDLETIVNNTDSYLGKKVVVTGRLVRNIMRAVDGLSDFTGEYGILIKDNLTTSEYSKYIKDSSVVIASGTIVENGEYAEFSIDSIKQNEQTKSSMNYIYAYQVSEIYDYSWEDGEQITIVGEYIENGSYSVPYSICDLNGSQFIQISSMADFGAYFSNGQTIVLTGNLYRTGTGYRLDVYAFG